MKTGIRLFFILALGLNIALPGRAQTNDDTRNITINTTTSRVNWTGERPGSGHNGYVKLSSGTLELSDNEVKGGSFVIDLNSIVNQDIENEGMKERLVNHLKSADFFDVENYPQAKFVISSVSRIPNQSSGNISATHKIDGNLTIKSITHPISFNASINALNGKVTATTLPFTIDRTLWNVNYQSKSIFANLKDQFINDEITFTVDLTSN